MVMAAAHRSCPELVEMLNSTTLQITTQAVGDDSLIGDVLTGVFHLQTSAPPTSRGGFPVATLHTPPRSAGDPPPPRRSVLLATDGQGHNTNGQGLLALPAGQSSQTRPPTTRKIPVPHRRFAHIHVDLVGPLPPSHGHTYLFTIIDRTSRWPEAIPHSSITAADCARALFARWVSQFGVPATTSHQTGGPSSRPPCGQASIACTT